MTAALLSAAALVLGFGVAEATGVRALGGAVLLVLALAAGHLVRRRAGVGAGLVAVAAVAVAFVASHLLADPLGAWPAVLLCAAAAAAVALALVRRATAGTVRP